jgi:hypothetical protein
MTKRDGGKSLTARQWWNEYVDDVREYNRDWLLLFGRNRPKPRRSIWGMIKRASKNVTRIPADAVRLSRLDYRRQKTSNLRLEVTVEGRRLILADARKGLMSGVNKPVYEALAKEQLVSEVNVRNIIRIKGISLGQFYKILTDLGLHITPFFSEDKGENGGRWVMDNRGLPELLSGKLDTQKDAYYLRKMFVQAPDWSFWGKWTNSRTHGMIYVIRKEDGKEEILVAAHLDAENAFVAIKEMLTGKKRRNIGAIEYHRMPEGQGEAYFGTGLSEWGCLILIELLKKARKTGLVKQVRVSGEEKLATTGSITEDDELMWQVYRISRQESGKI